MKKGILLYILSLIAFLTPGRLLALDVWDGTSVSTSLQGSGTQADPYQIWSGEDLKYLQQHSELWGNGKYFAQQLDIDLGGHEWLPIGNGSTAFDATYDGRGCKIINLFIDWGKFDRSNYIFGLFGYAKGTIRNVHLDNAVASRKALTLTSNDDTDLRIGLLVAAFSPYSKNQEAVIENIIITNSRIEDGGLVSNYATYFIGGLIGDMANALNGYNPITSSVGYMRIRNIYCDVDFDLPNCKRAHNDSKTTQFNVGGLVGRIRKGKYSDWPTNCFYRGKVNAPLATISPFISLARCNGDNSTATALTDAFAGEVLKSDTSSDYKVYIDGNSDAGDNRLFGDYYIYDSAIGDYSVITNDSPLPQLTRHGIRTLNEDVADNITWDKNSESSMRAWQGVAYGTYVDLTTGDGRTAVTDMLNTGTELPIIWNEAGTEVMFAPDPTISLSRSGVNTVNAHIQNYVSSNTYILVFTATLKDGSTDVVNYRTDLGSTFSTVNGKSYQLNLSNGEVRFTVPGDANDYSSISVELYNESNVLYATDSIEIAPVSFYIEMGFHTITRTTDQKDDNNEFIVEEIKDHYDLRPVVVIDGRTYEVGDELFDDLICQWLINIGGNWVDLSTTSNDVSASHTDADSHVAHISGYMGDVRLILNYSRNTNNYTLYYTDNGNRYDFAERTLRKVRLAISMYEYNKDGTTATFSPDDYFLTSSGYDLDYTSSSTEQSEDYGSYVDENGVTQYLTSANTHGTLNDTKVRPLIFKAQIVDELGEAWTSDNWRIQWGYTIPGDGKDDERTNSYYDKDLGFNLVNGKFDPEDTDNSGNYGILLSMDEPIGRTDWVGAYNRNPNHTSSDINFKRDRWGQFQVISSGDEHSLLIHPNLLHRTSAFKVYANLYNLEAGKVIDADSVEFNQLALKFERTKENGVLTNYAAEMVWRGDGTVYTSTTSGATFTWYASSDPTDYNSWVQVSQHSVDAGAPRSDTLCKTDDDFTFDPNLYYKLVALSGSSTLLTDIIGPQNVVYVYNRATTSNFSGDMGFDPYCAQTGEEYPNGQDFNTGHDPWNAVFTMERAYELLDAYDETIDANGNRVRTGTREDNRIVIMGYLHDTKYLEHNSNRSYALANYKKHVTLCGAFGNYIKGGVWGWGSGNGECHMSLVAPLTIENLDIYFATTYTGYDVLYCYNHDFTIGEGVRMCHYQNLQNDGGQETGVKAVNFTLVVGQYNNNEDWRNKEKKIDYTGNDVPGVTTVKLFSGAYGRIIGSSRYNTDRNTTSRNIYGAPWSPHRVHMVIDMKHKTDDPYEFMPVWNTSKAPTTEVGIMVGGLTDGSSYSDITVDLYEGKVSRYCAGNITWGRSFDSKDSNDSNYFKGPSDSFFGSTVLNIHGGSIDQLFGGSLGRNGESGDMIAGYFYGRSIINLYNGTIGKTGSEYSIYAAGAGCVTGLGKDWKYDKEDDNERSYTPDTRIPYFNSENTLNYGNFDTVTAEGCTIPSLNIYEFEDGELKYGNDGKPVLTEVALEDTYVEVNLYGGTVNGDVFGGSYGYSNQLSANRVPYRLLSDGKTRLSLAGNMYGNTTINILPNPDGGDPVRINGSVYGGSSGATQYIGQESGYDFTKVAQLFGNSIVNIEDGIIEGDVFAAGMGYEKYSEMANTYGDAKLIISGGEIKGNIYGGGQFSDLLSYTEDQAKKGGNTSVTINGGIIGNCVFGGGLGSESTASNVAGNAEVNINGGWFSSDPYVDEAKTERKNFNIYGGGYVNSIIGGSTSVNIASSPLGEIKTLGDDSFVDAWNDITFRRFCVYGGGWGEKTLVRGNASVTIDINEGSAGRILTAPQAQDITDLVTGQTFFDVAGGGYAGDVGYWATADGKPTSEMENPKLEDFDHYEGGDVTVTVKGSPFIRKVIGGAFYAQCNNTETHITSGTIKEVYGGALMGYVHNNGRLNIGTAVNDFLNAATLTEAEAAALNKNLFITTNVYGGNDVKGIVGTTKWKEQFAPNDPTYDGLESTDGEPLFCADVTPADNKGVTMIINGGTILGNVYGAGNGHYRGYYVPGWARYGDGPARQYRRVLKAGAAPGSKNEADYGYVYRCRPMVGKVSMHIGGNSATDSVYIGGDVYGGGRACTVGQWNTILPFEDPRRLAKGGFLHVNFGSHVLVDGSVYMGAEGSEFAEMHTVPEGIDLATFDGSSNERLNALGEVAYDHWYYHPDKKYYVPGFPKAGTTDGNFGIYAEHMFRAYVKNIEMNGDTELTFYENPYQVNDDGKVVYCDEDGNPGYVEDGKFIYGSQSKDADRSVYPVRKRWVPGELAISAYDSKGLQFTNFFGGGSCGSMTNNIMMKYDFTDGRPLLSDEIPETDHKIENYGSIYRYTLPEGLKILDRVVGGSENASFKVYKYGGTDDSEDYTELVKDTEHVRFTFDGGLVTQGTYSYFQIIYNDLHDKIDHNVTAEEYLKETYYEGKYLDSYTFKDGSVTIYPYSYINRVTFPNGSQLENPEYWMALQDAEGSTENKRSYCGAREERPEQTVLKLTVRAEFDPQEGEHDYDPDWDKDESINPTEHFIHYGGVVYGGCFNSGVLQGDVIVSVASNLIGGHLSARDPETFGQISTLQHNIGRVFGGGYGADSRIDGNTYVNLLKNFVGMNVFGGGCQGPVNGVANVQYLGDEAESYVFGAIYGGGLYGSVGVPHNENDIYAGTPIATNVKLYSGNVDKVYGGSCLGNLYGRTNVELTDQVYKALDHFDYDLADNASFINWGGARLIAGTVFAGNDIAGNIVSQSEAALGKDKDGTPIYDKLGDYSTYVYVHEEPDLETPTSAPAKESINPGKDTPGASGKYNGFPLIGNLYGGSNGNYGVHGDNNKYKSGVFKMATGSSNHMVKFYLGGVDAPDFDSEAENPYGTYGAREIPHVDNAFLDIQGGTLINVYGGGDKSSINKKTRLSVNYHYDNLTTDEGKALNDSIMDARAGFDVPNVEGVVDPLVRIWNTFHLSDDEQIEEVTSTSIYDEDTSETIFKYHIYRIFGGNDNADMAIQPEWNLVRGHVGSVYSGGNFGKMTFSKYDNTNAAGPQFQGLTLTINSADFHADAVFGGGRVGDIEPDFSDIDKALPPDSQDNAIIKARKELLDNFYGATLNIKEGVVDNVYGGNDVSGVVHYGSHVDIQGAISGNVYCAGNGNYRYQYDPTYTGQITEVYDTQYGGRYFILPQRTDGDYGADKPTDPQKLLAINSYRPNVERAYLSISGREPDSDGTDRKAFVRGNVFCGGNSSTVNAAADADGEYGDIKFEIGDYVVLNGVFLGSNGEGLVDPDMLAVTEALNKLELSTANTDTATKDDNPYLLDLYMKAVEITGTPKDFKLKSDLTEAYIGDFYVGGNHGSMLTDKTIGLTFPYNLVIYNRLIGGSNNANVTYKGVTHVGGLTTPLSTEPDQNGDLKYTDKVYLQVLSQFKPLKILYPVEGDYRKIALVPDLDFHKETQDVYFSEGKCSVFGGCYNSGKTVGNIHIDLYSDLVEEYDDDTRQKDIELLTKYFAESLKDLNVDLDKLTGDNLLSKERIIVNGIDKLSRRSFALIGGGYGSNTEVWGDIKLHMLPGQLHPDYTEYKKDADGNYMLDSDGNKIRGSYSTPSAATVFGGSQQGLVVGNTEIAVRDGMVLSNLYGASEARPMYGSTQIIIGWPQYYRCLRRGHFKLSRSDRWSKAVSGSDRWLNSDNTTKEAVLEDIWVREGELISVNLFNTLNKEEQPYLEESSNWDEKLLCNPDKDPSINAYFEFVDTDTPQKYADHNSSAYVDLHPITWDDIDIYIGNGKSRRDGREEYYAHGNVYGGGFVSATSSTSLAGQYTVRKFSNTYNNNSQKDADGNTLDLYYGGNSSIMVWDNIENRNPKNPIGGEALYDENDFDGNNNKGSKAIVKDHITIGTGHYVEIENLYPGMDIMGTYLFTKEENGKYDSTGRIWTEGSGDRYNYVHQSSKILEQKDIDVIPTDPNIKVGKYYEIESDGGIYGGGRKVYVEGFRNCDLAYYGYADYSPQYPKLLNTAQRLDLFSITDCCLFFEGASDFTTNTVDGTKYSLTRIGELQMHSSIPKDQKLNPGTRGTQAQLYNVLHLEPRTRNYIGFFHDVLYVAALTSSESFDQHFRGANGEFFSVEDYGDNGNENTTLDSDDWDYVSLPSPFSYKDYKKNRIENYYANRNLPNTGSNGEDNQDIKNKTSLEFDQRNIGTAANMIGINNGYTLKIQGAGKVATYDTEYNIISTEDKTYFGPVCGVFEIKLMTLAMDEGGGYIYALNQHDDPNHFLETTGNFIFPGAAYRADTKNYNYIYDDCFPMGEGWDSYYGWEDSESFSSSSMGHGSRATISVDPNHGDCNEEQEVHYWYVNGTHYYYNVTLTAIAMNTSNQFTLNNNDQLVYLYGVDNGSKIYLENVIWQPITDTLVTDSETGEIISGYQSDLQNYGSEGGIYKKDYQLYLTVDKDPSKAHNLESTLAQTGYVVMVPRADGEGTVNRDEDGNFINYDFTTLDLVAGSVDAMNNYSTSGEGGNKPLLGFSLYDNVDNSGSVYYNAHLDQDEKVRLVLSSKNDQADYKYTINLTIRYLLGPTIKGVPVIENCALPGEYIYANDFGVKVELDGESMALLGHDWMLRYDNGESESLNSHTLDTDGHIAIPAYLYRNGATIEYQLVTNAGNIMVSDSETPMQLTVHNYHRMKPYQPTSDASLTPKIEDLYLTKGARIYIENDEDMAYFFEWLNTLQNAASENVNVDLKGGAVKNPQYGAGLNIYLMDDVKMPASGVITGLRFDGTFHGNGHSIDMGENKQFLGDNRGKIYNTGFLTGLDKEDAIVFAENNGVIENCFVYNKKRDTEHGRLIGDNKATTSVVNIFSTNLKNAADGVQQKSFDDFDYGQVAYNLNRFYLKKRYNKATGTDDGDIVAPLKDIYDDGSYRYAHWQSRPTSEAQRTAEVPNYHDYLGIRYPISETEYTGTITGKEASMHDAAHKIDTSRAADADGNLIYDEYGLLKEGMTFDHYEPIFPTDYLFFGQDLAYGSQEDPWPHAIAETKRVYRASGFYGSKMDYGFHFNEKAYAVQPTLTGIDFAGISDSNHNNGEYKIDDEGYADDYKIWYAPALDLPDAYATPSVENHGIKSFTTSTREQTSTVDLGDTYEQGLVSRNLLIYRKPDLGLFNDWKEQETNNSLNIFGHVIDFDGTDASTEYFQLVDKEDFNCPLAFDVTEKIWYERAPEVFATKDSDGWDGLCLPFTVRKVYGVADGDAMYDRGELSHFYGAEVGKENVEISHEYWLRKFTKVDKDKAYFARPGSNDDSNAQEKQLSTYHYSNTYFTDLYGIDYNKDADHLAQESAKGYTKEGIDFGSYPMITAGYPYIVSYPGERYYEFDCSGEFYANKFKAAAVPQIITYAWEREASGSTSLYASSTDLATAAKQRIPVTDNGYEPARFVHDPYTHTGTYMHKEATSHLRLLDPNEDTNGATFERTSGYGNVILPFRSYMIGKDSKDETIYISSRGAEEEIEPGEDDGDAFSELRIWADGSELVVESPYEEPFHLTVYNIKGQAVRMISVEPGENRYHGFSPAFYLVHTTKVMIR